MIQKQSGFTLLEVLIGMSLLSVMMLLLFASLRICVQNWNAGEKKIAQVSQAAIVQNFLRSKLHSTLPLRADFFEEEQFSFQGEEDKLQFVASMPASAGRLGLQLFNLSLEKSNRQEGSRLLVDIQPFFPQNEEWEEEQVVILKKIQSLRFSYFGAEQQTDDPDWQNVWLEQNRLPDLIAIDVELNNGDVWPQLVVALNIDAAVGGGNRNIFGIVNGKFQRP